MLAKALEQLLNQTGLRKRLSEQSQTRAVRNAVLDAESQKPRERQPVAHLILDLFVGQIVKRLQHSIRNITMTSIGLRPAVLFFSLTGVNTAASISERKLSNGTTWETISSGSPFAVSAASGRSASKIRIAPWYPPANLVAVTRLAQIRACRYFSRWPYD
jgi:hypothetical protein